MNQGVSAVLHTALCVLLLALAYVLQTSIGLRVSVLGAHVDLLPLIVAAAGMTHGAGTGLVCGLAAGILYDVSGVGVEGLYPLYYMLAGIASGVARERFRGREPYGAVLCAVCTIVALAVLRYLFYFQFGGTELLTFVRDLLLRALLAAVLSPLVLAVVRRIGGQRSGGRSISPHV